MIRIALCDDKIDFLNQEYQVAEKHLIDLGVKYSISKFMSGIDLISENKINSYDLILLDYEMNGMTGFETAKLIRERSEKTCIAFVTVFYEFSREGYRFDAIRYLVKNEPNFEMEINDCIDKAIRLKEKNKRNTLFFEFMDKAMRVEPEKIIYIIAEKHYLVFTILENTGISEHKLRSKMGTVMKELDKTNMFSLVRTGQLVNLRFVKTIDKKGIVWVSYMENLAKMFQTSDSRKKDFISDYMRYLGED